MRLPLTAALPALLLACGSGEAGRAYDNNDLQLATSYSAKEVCSCVFVMGHTEEYCRSWTRASPAVAVFRVDHEAKTVESSAVMLWGKRARFTGERFGCVLE